MPPPMVPAPTIATDSTGARRRVGRHVRDLRRGALGEEGVAQRARLRGGEQREEERALEREAVVEAARDRGLHRVDAPGGRGIVPRLARDPLAGRLEEARLGGRGRRPVAQPRQGALRGDAAGERDRPLAQLALDHRVDQGGRLQRPGARGRAGEDHRRAPSRRPPRAAAAACRPRRAAGPASPRAARAARRGGPRGSGRRARARGRRPCTRPRSPPPPAWRSPRCRR